MIWAGGILWTAIDVAGVAPAHHFDNDAAPTDATGEVVQNGDLEILAAAMKAD